MKKVTVDKATCIGCGTCAALCDKVFELGKEGKAQVKVGWQAGDKELPECAREAIDSCPVSAIKSAD
jgi:ferredoxin